MTDESKPQLDEAKRLPLVRNDPKSWGTIVGIEVTTDGKLRVRSNNEEMMVVVWDAPAGPMFDALAFEPYASAKDE